MSRETQLDTHEIDKLLADDDFIDDFDFDEDESLDFVDEGLGTHDDSALGLEDDPVVEAPDDFSLAATAPTPEVSGLVASEEIMAEVAHDLDDLELSNWFSRRSRKSHFTIFAALALLLLVSQVLLMIYLWQRPVLIRDQARALSPEVDLRQKPAPQPLVSPVSEEALPLPDQPQVILYKFYTPIYSLNGLKIINSEIEVVQFPPGAHLNEVEQKNLEIILGRRLRTLTETLMKEEIKDIQNLFGPKIIGLIQDFFNQRGRPEGKLEIRIIGLHIQE